MARTTPTTVSQIWIPRFQKRLQIHDPRGAKSLNVAAFCPNPLSGGGSSVGLSENTANSIQVAPNPFDTELEITANAPIQSLILRDAQGKLVLRQEATSNTIKIETATLQNGIYFLEVQTANGLELVKVVK